MATIHVTQTEAERDLHSLLSRVDQDTSFVIVDGSQAVAILQAPPRRPTFRQRLAALPDDAEAVMDEDSAKDVQAAIAFHREPLDARSLEERVRRLPRRTDAIMDDDFASDVKAAVEAHREPLNRSLWDE